MFVHGDGRTLPMSPDDMQSPVNLFIRFGSDVNNYYEYGQELYAGWSRLNEMDIDLDELARTKFTENKQAPVPDRPGGYYKVQGNPSLNTIRYFRVGVKNIDSIPWTGEVWLDEMRVSGVRQEKGSALRLSTSLKVADLFTFNGNWESKDADFHDIKTQFGSGNSIESQNYSGVFNAHKLLPTSLNISIPIDARASFSKNIPKYFPKTDILTGYKNDSFMEKIQSLFGLKLLNPALERQVSFSEVYGVGTTIKRSTKSDFWLFYHTIDQLTIDFDYSLKNSRNYQTSFRRAEQWRYAISYGIPFGKENFIEPFKVLEPFPLLSELATEKIYFTPNSTTFSVNITDQTQASRLRTESNVTQTVNRGSTRKVSIGYRLLQSVNMSLTRTHKADADFIGWSGKEMWKAIFTEFNFGKDTDINQAFKFDYKPKLINWLTTDFSYSSNFRYYFVNLSKNQKQSSNKITKRASVSFNPSQLVNMIYSPAEEKKSGDKAKRGRSRRPAKKPETKEEEPEEKKEEKNVTEEAQISIPNPLMLIYGFFDAWKKIQTSYTWNENVVNSFVSEIPTLNYQFGLTKDPGVPQDTSFSAILVGPAITDSRSLRSSMNFDLSKNIKMTFNHEYSVAETRNDKTRTGNESSTFLAWGDDPGKEFDGLAGDIRRWIPDWTIKISGLEKILFFEGLAKTVSVEHSRSGKYTNQKKLANNELVPSTESFSHNFQPLVGVNITWVGDVRSTIRLSEGATFNFKSAGGSTRSENKTLSISASYATSGGFQIPIPIWPFKGASFKNEINFTLSYDRSVNKTFQKQVDQGEFQENQNNTSWKLRPAASYRFNKRVSGSLYYETGVTENKISGKFSWNEFGITVNIAIRD
jgi:cell surface protein SprA